VLLNGNTFRQEPIALLLDATSPILGAASTPFFQVADEQLLIYLGFFAGFLLYIGGSDILPKARHPPY
jgi:zinc transporter ZupT